MKITQVGIQPTTPVIGTVVRKSFFQILLLLKKLLLSTNLFFLKIMNLE